MPQKRLEYSEALQLLCEANQLDLMERAFSVRQEMHPGSDVTFVIDTNPNYTNICITQCDFCSFYRSRNHPEAYTLTPEEIAAKALSAWEAGATTLLLQGGHNPALSLPYFIAVMEAVKAAAPDMHLHLFSPSEILHIASISGKDPVEILRIFKELGMTTMPGGGAEILVDTVRRKISPRKSNSDSWFQVMGFAHQLGIKTSATMTYGHCETPEDIVEHLFRIRSLQDCTGGFYAFIPWSYKPGTSRLASIVPLPELPSYYVRIIALSRLILDNIPHIQASWFGEGWRAGQLALYAGADDFGGLLLEENVMFQAGHSPTANLESILDTIQGAGFVPVQRNSMYEKLCRYDLHNNRAESGNINYGPDTDIHENKVFGGTPI